jgi:hypothetical protein
LAAKNSRAMLDVLGGHAQARALAHGAGVVEVGAHRHADAALGDLQVQRLVQALAAVLDERVLAGHAEVGAAVLHVGRHVGRAHQHHPQARTLVARISLRDFSGSSETSMPAAFSSGRVSSKMRPFDSASVIKVPLRSFHSLDVRADAAQLGFHLS